MADNLDYDGIIREIDGFDPKDNEEGLMQGYNADRMVELQKELSAVAQSDRNDEYELVWQGLYDKANDLIAELAGQSMDGITAEQSAAFRSLLENFSSHVDDKYSGIAAELKSKLDARDEELKRDLEAESKQEEQTPEDEVAPQGEAEEISNDEDADIKDTQLDNSKQAFLDSITEENKEQIVERFNKIDKVADELGDVFAVPEDENAEDKFKGLRNLYDNLWVDRDMSEEDTKPSQDDLKKQQQLKERIKDMATIMAIEDLTADSQTDGLSKEELKEKLRDTVRNNMEYLTYNLVSNQAIFKILEEGQDITKLTSEQRNEYMSAALNGGSDLFQNLQNALDGKEFGAMSVSSPAIVATIVPQYKESKKFAKELKDKTGIKEQEDRVEKRNGIQKLWSRVKDFDAKMNKDHPYLWGFAKSMTISTLTGPAGIMAYTGYSTYKQFKGLWSDYKSQKENPQAVLVDGKPVIGEDGKPVLKEALSFGQFCGQNKGKILSSVVGIGLASCGGINAVCAGNFGLISNMTGSLLSGDALNSISQNLSWENLKNGAENMVDKISNINNISISQVWEGIKNTYSPGRLMRLGSSLGVGIAKGHDAYLQAEDGNKWKAARKAFMAHLTGTLTSYALMDAMTASGEVIHQTSIDIQKIESVEQDVQGQLKGLGLGQDAYHIGDPNSGVHIGIETPKLDDISIPNAPTPEQVLDVHPASPAPQPEVPPTDPVVKTEIETEKTVELKVNGQEVEAKLGNTLEETLDNAREEYLNANSDIDPNNNTVVIEGEGGKATIETQKEDIVKGEAIIGQETSVHREINTDEAQMQDDIQEVKTDTGQAKMMESEGRMDVDTNNNIPDGAKILNVTEFHNGNQDLKITEYEQDGKVYITDGNQTRLAPEGQSAEQRMETWKNMLKETAATRYDDSGQPIVTEQPAQAQQEIREEVKEEAGTIKKEINQTQARVTEPEVKETHMTEQAPNNVGATQNDAVQNMGVTPLTTTQSGVSYSISENGNLQINANFGGIYEDGTLNMRYLNHLMPEQYHNVISEESMLVKSELRSIIMNHEIYNDLQAQAETRELTGNEKNFMKVHEARLEQNGLVNRGDGVLEYKDTPKDQYFHVKQEQIVEAVNESDTQTTKEGNAVTDNITNSEENKENAVTDNVTKTGEKQQDTEVKSEQVRKLSPAEQVNKLRSVKVGANNKISLADRVKDYTSGNQVGDKYQQFVNSANQKYEDNNAAVNEAYNAHIENTNIKYNEHIDKTNEAVEANHIKQQENYKAFLAEKEAYASAHKGYQNYEAGVQQLGLKNSLPLAQTQGMEERAYQADGVSDSYMIYKQTEFRQGSNGFAIAHNDEIRSVVADSKGNLQFKVTENGESRLMTKDEATNFCRDLRTQGEKINGFNNELLDKISTTKQLADSHNAIEYRSESPVHATGTRVQTNNLGMNLNNGGRKI